MFKAAILCVFVYSAVSHGLVDFTYTEYVQPTSAPRFISIIPSDINYEFPDLCDLEEKLKMTGSFDHSVEPIDHHSRLEELKRRFIELLQTGERIKRGRRNIKDIGDTLRKQTSIKLDFTYEIASLSQEEEALLLLKNQITAKIAKLESLAGSGNGAEGLYSNIALEYKIQTLLSKEQYLLDLQHKLKLNPPSQPNSEEKLLTQIDLLLEEGGEAKDVEFQINQLKKQRQMYELTIKEKKQCENQKQKIIKGQQMSTNIETHIESLKKYKATHDDTANKICEGIVKKLIIQLKRKLSLYNYVFGCSQGISENEQIVRKKNKEIERLQQRLKALGKQSIEDLTIKYQTQRSTIDSLILKLRSSFQTNKKLHQLSVVQELLQKTKNKLFVLASMKKVATPETRKDEQIRALIAKIKQLKEKYCEKYEKYEALAKEVQTKMHNYEAETRLEIKLTSMMEIEQQKMVQLESKFKELRQTLLFAIK